MCGKKDITLHHMRRDEIKSKKNRRKCNGIIPLCKECHQIVEDIVNKGKAKKLWYKKGFEDGYKQKENEIEFNLT